MDLRIPSGWFFVLTGGIVLAMGVFSPARPRLIDVNINLYTGFFMMLFGGALLFASRGRHG
jgi:hypothetical protein